MTFSYQIGADGAANEAEKSEKDGAYALMKRAYAAGINLFDNAEAYAAGKSETIMGECIARGVAEGVWAREDLVITTKLFFGTRPGPNNKGLSAKHIHEGTLASLKRFQLDYVDVLYCHRPDPVTPIEETVRAMAAQLAAGRALYWGTSEWSAADILTAVGVADRLGLPRPVVEQPEYNLYARTRVEQEYAPVYAETGLGLTTWSPLASGVLTGKYASKTVPEGSRLSVANYKFILDDKLGKNVWQVDATEELRPIAAELGCSLAQLSIAWCLVNPRVSSVILGATSVKQLEENLGALDVVARLTPEVRARMESVGGGRGQPAVHGVVTQTTTVRDTAGLANFRLHGGL